MFNKNLITKFFKVLNFHAENFTIEKIKDSDQSLEYAELVVGADILISGANGSEVAPDGDYALANGAEIKVAEGKIAGVVKAADEEKPEAEQELAEEEKPEDAPAKDESKEAELQAKIDELEAEIKQIKEGFSALPTKQDLAKFQSDLEAEFKKLEKIPTQFSTVDKRVELQDSTPEDKFKAIAKSFSK
ncbi:hypothetical protein OQZ33_07095 [Pedobacter sp. MC2016-05]|uniref:hypothetical protein n=1 Tax=Pedobacter sp. MC2016-05 TaxID=2994474 RepID=UPI00224682DB|nr:hypothetical protein [Pedobacter sp. MC2016-05]MCX2474091.1 hypothetical protein [Pedobacter sp. MC2016-05]